MHNANQRTPLEDFVAQRFGVGDPEPSPGELAEAERQEALRERAARVRQWQNWSAQPHAPIADALPTGAALKEVRSASGLDAGMVASITGTTAADVEAAERGAVTFADGVYRQFAAAARDALRAQGSS